MATPNVTTDRSAVRRVGTVLLVGGLGYLFAAFAVEGSGSLREVLLRYAFVVAGIFAVAPPHVLLPDAAAAFLQMLNPSPRALLLRQGKPWGFIVAAFLVPPVLLAVEMGGAVVRAARSKSRSSCSASGCMPSRTTRRSDPIRRRGRRAGRAAGTGGSWRRTSARACTSRSASCRPCWRRRGCSRSAQR